ncbi:efflux RND transporter periplasmic adaptor subunit [Sandaracinobacter sp. RS1-74]|uniref:efflux RND transporter periplasmic adaptor subunit n=1 Tax=Sandaracinobacteroides sayramensis TaxID=2913411 RepID=UPI001EDA0970|nr:efflux RND transporter periplasmic adaptor subunit [Sandaracinobacteroides sayramensis]MCG2840677.1 efflux RND transporter periplasmic adaptor subunit [Sandaracinobacteroides sayramensis]
MDTPSSRRNRWIAAGATAVALLLAAWWLRPPDTTYQTVEIGRGDIAATVNALGTVQPQTAVDVGAQVSGQIKRLAVQPGDQVEQGQLLAEIDPSIPLATVEAGRAQLAGLRAQLAEQQAQEELARRQYARQQQMDRDGSTRTEDVQVAEAAMKAASARVANLRAQIEQTASRLRGEEAQLGFTRIYAPIAGTVVSVEAKPGQTLNATYQTPTILRIADLTRMTVSTQVSEADIHRVNPGMTARFTTLGDDRRNWTGQVRQVLPAPPRATGEASAAADAGRTGGKVIAYTVLFDVANDDDALMPEMTAQVVFTTASAKGVLIAPLAALTESRSSPDSYTARVMVDGRIVERHILGGMRDRMSVQVLDGLKAGDRLIVDEGSAS